MIDALPDWVAHRAASAPNALALRAGGADLTYAELDARVSSLAGTLAGHGVRPGSRVALLAQNSAEFVLAVHAVPRMGATLVPLNVRLSPSELAWQLEHSGAALLLFHPPTADLAAATGEIRPIVARVDLGSLVASTTGDAKELTSGHAHLGAHPASAHHSVIYTSGTTGHPKGAILTFGNFWASAAASAYNMGVLPGDRWLACLPLFHVGGLSILLRSAIQGTAAVVHESFDERSVNRALRQEGVSVLSVVPTMLMRMLDADALPYPPSVRAVLVGGGPMTRDLLQRALDRGLPVLQTYGLTEAASQVTTLAPADALAHVGSAGKPLVSTRVRVAAPAGEPGEILVAGPTVTPGYLDAPEATARALRGGWLHTGDIGRIDAQGFLYVLDRRDDLIVSGGENVYPAEVEAVLLLHPLVEAAAVVGVTDGRWGQAVCAAIVARPGFEAGEVESFLRQRLAAYKLPRRIVTVDALPTTASGKVQRHRVRELLKG